MKFNLLHLPLALCYPGGAPGFTKVLEDLSPTFMSPHSVTLKSRDKYGPAHHHISFGFNKYTGEVEFINSDNDPKKFKGLILRLTGAEFGAIPKGFKGFYSNSNYLTHANRVEKSTNDVSFPITCVRGDHVKVEATMAVHKFLFFYNLVGEFIC